MLFVPRTPATLAPAVVDTTLASGANITTGIEHQFSPLPATEAPPAAGPAPPPATTKFEVVCEDESPEVPRPVVAAAKMPPGRAKMAKKVKVLTGAEQVQYHTDHLCRIPQLGRCTRPQYQDSLYCRVHACIAELEDGTKCGRLVQHPLKSRFCEEGYHMELERHDPKCRHPEILEGIARRKAFQELEAEAKRIQEALDSAYIDKHYGLESPSSVVHSLPEEHRQKQRRDRQQRQRSSAASSSTLSTLSSGGTGTTGSTSAISVYDLVTPHPDPITGEIGEDAYDIPWSGYVGYTSVDGYRVCAPPPEEKAKAAARAKAIEETVQEPMGKRSFRPEDANMVWVWPCPDPEEMAERTAKAKAAKEKQRRRRLVQEKREVAAELERVRWRAAQRGLGSSL